MKQKTRDRILASWDLHNDDDISTERLFAMVCDDCNCDSGDVAEALRLRHEEQKNEA